MKIATNVEIIKRKGGSLISIINGESKAEIDPARITALNEIYDNARGIDEDKREAWLNEQIADGKWSEIFGEGATSLATLLLLLRPRWKRFRLPFSV